MAWFDGETGSISTAFEANIAIGISRLRQAQGRDFGKELGGGQTS